MPSDPILRFGIITDTHIRPDGPDESSPYQVNLKANNRAAFAARLLAAQETDLNFHLGDVVHPLPDLPTYDAACREAKKLLAPLGPGLHIVPGNHDIGDKPYPGSPAAPVNAQNEEAFRRSLGKTRNSFAYGGIRFILINSSLVNSGGGSDAAQRDWLEAELHRCKHERIFLFSHYPPFIESASEPEHYDNYAEPGRSWLLNLAADSGVEAILSGHVHHFFYNRFNGVRLYCLPATSFTRQDYSEMFHVGPAPEMGRDDVGKFMVCVVDVSEHDHRLRFIETQGAEDLRTPLGHPEELAKDNALTVHMRHSWARAVELPYQGPMEEFSRKRARNDYPLLRLWQMGIGQVRTPLADLLDPSQRDRMADWAAAGIGFCVVCQDVPKSDSLAIIRKHHHFISSLEIAFNNTEPENLEDLRALGIPVRLGRICTSAHQRKSGSKFTHTVQFGYAPSEIDQLRKWLENHDGIGAAIRIGPSDNIEETCARAAQLSLAGDRPISVIIALGLDNPAECQDDEDWAIDRVLAASSAARRFPTIEVQIDTFSSIDRGYHPRIGLIDRRSNLTRVGCSLVSSSPET